MADNVYLKAIDDLIERWEKDDTKSVAESREQSAEVIRGVVGPVIAKAENKYKPAMLALESLTPGGSEFVGDVERCVAHVRDRQSVQHGLAVKYKKQRDDLERRLEIVKGLLQTLSGVGPARATLEQALARIGAPLAPREDDEPHPEFIRGYLAAADDLAEPYPPDMFTPLTDEQRKAAVEAMGGDISGRLHAHWARHWADVLRKRSTEK